MSTSIPAVLKRLSFGLSLIGLAALLLLLSDLESRRTARSSAQAAGSQDSGTGKLWRVRILEFVNVVDSEEAEKGVFDGLRQGGVVEGKDFEQQILNAQGDMATLNSLVDAATTDRADLIITLSTPTLQAALQRAGSTPIVHTFISSPHAAGAGTSDTDHKPNVTGSYGSGDNEGMIRLIRTLMPQARRIGLLATPGEVNGVFQYDRLLQSAKAAGFETETVGMNSPAEVSDAAMALCGRPIDLLCIPNSNLVASSFPAIARAARQARLPVFGFFSNLARQGGMVALSRDYYTMGQDAGLIAARVIRGESPAEIPLKLTDTNRLLINLDVAASLGISIPDDVRRRADELVGGSR